MSIIEGIRTRTGERTTLSDDAIASLDRDFRGPLVRPDDAQYDDVRSVWNGMIDKHPKLVARCTGTSDVVAAVRFARTHDLLVAVRGGGHNVAGNAVCDDGLVIDLSAMKGIQVDPVKRVASAQPGVNWGELDHETQLHGLATPGGQMSETGIAGFTLAGGMGFLRRKWGLACDNLLSAEIVTADGEVRRASVTEHPDLFWAIRGGGGNFGVVTSFEFALHPIGPEIFGGITIYPFEQAAAVLRGWREFVLNAPDEVTCDVILFGMPPLPDVPVEMHWAPVAIVAGLYAGTPEDGERALEPARRLGTPIGDLFGRQPYVRIQSDFDPLMPPGQMYYWKSLFADRMSDALVDAIVATHAGRPSPQTMIAIRSLGGMMGRVPEQSTAYGNRAAKFNVSVDNSWQDPTRNDEMIGWTRAAWSRLRDMTGGGVYLNFAGLGEENDTLARAGYGRNHDRLVEIKRRYDPGNRFRGNVNIAPQ